MNSFICFGFSGLKRSPHGNHVLLFKSLGYNVCVSMWRHFGQSWRHQSDPGMAGHLITNWKMDRSLDTWTDAQRPVSRKGSRQREIWAIISWAKTWFTVLDRLRRIAKRMITYVTHVRLVLMKMRTAERTVEMRGWGGQAVRKGNISLVHYLATYLTAGLSLGS